jgi:hypothetical protein
MRPNAIYSKSGKGVQEASGKTTLLKREHRAVLAAIDGRATLADVAQKSGNAYDAEFQRLIVQLDKDGFIREVSSGTAAGPAAATTKPAGKLDTAIDLDFSSLASSQKANTAPQPTAPPPPPKAPALDMAAKAAAERRAKEQESALHRARQEAEEKAQAERDRQRAAAEAKVRAETEARLRVEAEKKLREEAAHKVRADAVAKAQADAEARVKAAREAAARVAAEQKAKAETELRVNLDAERRAHEEAERRAREEAERARREVEEKARREQEELRKRLEEERRAREEVERKARGEAERIRQEVEEQARREAEALRQQIEEERKAREEAERRAREEMNRARLEREERARRAEERKHKQSEPPAAAPPPPPRPQPAPGSDKFADSLFADLDSFNKREEEGRKKDEEDERATNEERLRKARAMEELRAREEEEQRKAEEKQLAREEEERRAKEEEERLARENEERERKFREEEDKRARESEERSRKAKEESILAAKTRGDMASGDTSLQDRRAKALKRGPGVAAAHRRQERNWGKPVAVTLLVILGVALGALHFIPISTADYEKAAREALGQPVRLASGRISLWRGVHYEFKDVRIGERVRIAEVRAFPALEALFDEKKIFKRVELEGAVLPQDVLGEALFARANGESFTLGRVLAKQLKLEGPLALPPLDVDVALDAAGAPRVASLAGPENLVANLSSKGSLLEFEMSATSFALPIAPELSLAQFGMKGTITRRGMNISSWDGAALNGNVSGTAQVRWGSTWNVEGVLTARGINAAAFAPALLSEGRGEGTGRFWMTGSEPAKLASSGRLEGNFTVNKGVLGSFDLSRAIQTGGQEVTGRTRFTEMNGQAIYNAGAVTLRNVNIGAGALNAGASADIAQSGALSGRIVIDVRTSTQVLRTILILGGTVKEPQVRN